MAGTSCSGASDATDCSAEGRAEDARCEVFLGGLPRGTADIPAVQAGLHAALVAFCVAGTPPAHVRLRLHTDNAGRGLGFGFGWLPDASTAERLVQAQEIFFDVAGRRVRAGVRAARGHASGRPAPMADASLEPLSVAVCTTSDASWLSAHLSGWASKLRMHGIGLEVQLRSISVQMRLSDSLEPLDSLGSDAHTALGDGPRAAREDQRAAPEAAGALPESSCEEAHTTATNEPRLEDAEAGKRPQQGAACALTAGRAAVGEGLGCCGSRRREGGKRRSWRQLERRRQLLRASELLRFAECAHADALVIVWRQLDLSVEDRAALLNCVRVLAKAGRALLVVEARRMPGQPSDGCPYASATAAPADPRADSGAVDSPPQAGSTARAETVEEAGRSQTSVRGASCSASQASAADQVFSGSASAQPSLPSRAHEVLGALPPTWCSRATACSAHAPAVAVPAPANAPVPARGLASAAGSEDSDAPDFSAALAKAAAEVGGRIDVVSFSELVALYAGSDCCLERHAAAICAVAIRRAVGHRLSHELKVFVSDCDQTLWAGVVSEDGVDGVSFAEPHLSLHRRLCALQRSGRLLCLASRNDEDEVRQVFSERAGEMGIAAEQLTAWQVHWGAKVGSLRKLAMQLQLSPSAFVFLDDNPAETHAVARALPEVLAITVPGGDADAFERVVRHHWALDAWAGAASTAEDALRTQMYRDRAARRELRRELRHLPLADFSRELQLRIDIRRPTGDAEHERVAQLTMRTNQMNSTMLRLPSAAALREWLAESAGRFVLAAWVSDRFGEYGLVACALCDAAEGEAHVLLECLNMSCRVLHRGVERAVLLRLAHEATAKKRTRLLLPLVASEGQRKGNGRMQRFVGLLREWHAVAASEANTIGSRPPCKGESDEVSYPSLTVHVGKYGAKRGLPALAFSLSVETLLLLQSASAEVLDSQEEENDESVEAEAATEEASIEVMKGGPSGSSVADDARTRAVNSTRATGTADSGPSLEGTRYSDSDSGDAQMKSRRADWSGLLEEIAYQGHMLPSCQHSNASKSTM